MTTPGNGNNNTSYKPFAISNYANNEDDQLYSTRLSAIDEEIIKTTTLLQLKEKLFNLPHGLKSSLVYAQQVTDIVNDDHLLGFLYVENYNVDVSLLLDALTHGTYSLQLQISHIFFVSAQLHHI